MLIRWVLGLVIALVLANPVAQASFAIFQASTGSSAPCPFGSALSDGCQTAPSGSAQSPSLLSGYVKSPHTIATPWNVAGVDYPVGINTNATSSGNTITETGVVNIPVNGDKKTFYPPMNASWILVASAVTGSVPSGITIATAYFLCNVSGSSTTYSYTLSTTSNCLSPVTLGAFSTSFIALKDPLHTANLPSVGSGGTWPLPGNNQILINATSAVVDHFDFSLEGGWYLHLNGPSQTTTNNYMSSGSNSLNCGFVDNSASDPTWSNNVCNGNGVNVGGNQFEINGSGTVTLQYNVIVNTWAETLFAGGNTASTTAYTIRYNFIANPGYGGCSAVHADWIQYYNTVGSFQSTLNLSFNTFYQSVVFCGSGPQGLSLQSAGGASLAAAGNQTIGNNTLIAVNAAVIGYMIIVDTCNLNGTATVSNNFLDPTGTGIGAMFVGQFNGGTVATSVATGAGGTTLTFGSTFNFTNGGTSAGSGVIDVTTPAAIPAGDVVSTISGTQIVLTPSNVAAPGVGLGDLIRTRDLGFSGIASGCAAGNTTNFNMTNGAALSDSHCQ